MENLVQRTVLIASVTILTLPAYAQNVCAPHTPGGVVMTEGRGGIRFSIAVGASHTGVVDWIEHGRWSRADLRSEPPPQMFMSREFDANTVAPTRPATSLFEQTEPYEIGLPLAAFPLANGGTASAFCTCYGGSAATGCTLVPTRSGPAPQFPTSHASSTCPSGQIAAAAVDNAVVLSMPCPDCGGFRIYSTAARRPRDVESDGEIQVPAMAPAPPGRVVYVRRISGGIEARMIRADGQPDGGPMVVSEGGYEVGAPAVLWSGSSAWIVFAQRRRHSQPWQLGLATWTPGRTVSHAVIATGSAPAMAPALAASSTAGCFVLSWTEGTGHSTVARAGRVCNGALEAASVAQLSQPSIEAGDSELASDGTNVYAVWQELPGRPATHEELRVTRLGCH